MRLPTQNLRLLGIGGVAALSLFLVAGCGEDDDEGSQDNDGTASVPAEVTTEPVEAFASCDAIPESTGGALNEGAVIEMIDFEFCEPAITIEAGQTVEFVNYGATRHQVAHEPPDDEEREFRAPEAIQPGDSYIITLDTPGVYPYFCSFHVEEMSGELVVE